MGDVEQDVFIARSLDALRQAMSQHDLPWIEPVLIRAAANVVWRCGDVVAKVFKETANAERVVDSVGIAAALSDAGAPVLAPMGEVVRTPHGNVSLWPYVDSVRDLRWLDLGRAVAALHATSIDLPVVSWEPEIGTRWATNAYRDSGGDAGLAQALDDFSIELSANMLATDMGPECVIQGDVSPYNVVVRNGELLLIDMDWVAQGPAVIDFSAARVYQSARRITADQRSDFESAFGEAASEDALMMVERLHHFRDLIFNLAMACQRGQDTSWVAAEFRSLKS